MKYYDTGAVTINLKNTIWDVPVEKNLSCGEISNFYTSVMGRNLEFLHMWFNFKFLHMTDVEKFEISFIVCSIYGIFLHLVMLDYWALKVRQLELDF